MTTETLVRDNLLAGGVPPVLGRGTLALGAGALTRGSVLGRILLAIAAAAAGENNTGNGTCTGVALGVGAQVGTYTLTCVGSSGTLAAVAGDAVGTGNGVLTLDATTPLLTGAQPGVYQIVCVEPGTNVGTFQVLDPNGVFIGSYTVGGADFATQIKFAIADGSTDFAAGDYFEVTVTAGVPSNGLATFTVTDPNGAALANATVGTAYVGQVLFTLNDGTTNFAIGDAFTIAVSATLGNWKLCNSASTDGSQHPDMILAEAADATSVAVPVPTYLEGVFNEDALTFGGTDTADTHRQAMRDKGMHLQTVIHG
jgi:hypothetical protein